MKNGLLTVCRMNNNGTDLQCAAMYHIFSKIYKNLEVINYKSPKFEKTRKIFKSFSIKSFLLVPYYIFLNSSHHLFRKKHLSLSKKIAEKNFNSLNQCERIIVGSDQIWNLEISEDINFFLPGLPDVKKISYACSLGKTDVFELENKYHFSNYLKNFSNISVREESGVKALKTLGIDSREDLDPILLVEKEWIKSLFKLQRISFKFVLLYLVERNDDSLNFAKEIAKQMGTKVIMISEPTFKKKGIRIKSFVGLEKWLNYLYQSECVITNSYHCISTSIALNKPFVYFDLKNKEKNTRVECLLKKLNLDKNALEINYDDVLPTLERLRKRSYNFIEGEASNER